MLSGPEKAVLFLLSLDEEAAKAIVNELSEGDLRGLRAVAATMREVPGGALDETFEDFLQRSATAVAVPRGGLSYLRKLSTRALGEERTRAVFEDSVTSPLARLEAASPDAVAALLALEPPQLTGAIIARMTPPAAAAILAAMPEDRQAAAVAHVGRMTELPAKVLEDMAAALAQDLPSPDASTSVNVDGMARVAEILNAAGRNTSSAILATLEQDDAEFASEIRQAMFTFEDVARLDSRALRELLREVPAEKLTTALKGTSDEVRDDVLTGVSSRAAELIRDDLALLGNVKRADVEAARKEIVQIALRLEGEGRIDLGRGGEG